MTDWAAWHVGYDDPASDQSARLAIVEDQVRRWAHTPGRLISMCAGEGRDVVGALRDHPRREEVTGLLVELLPANAAAAAEGLARAGLTGLAVVVADGGTTTPYAPAAPADLVLACGIFGNITDEDVRRTVHALPMLCAPGATVVWTRHRRSPDLTESIRPWLVEAGFEETGFFSPGPSRFSVGVAVLRGDPRPFEADLRLFDFVR